MIEAYNTLRQTYIIEGFEEAYKYIEHLQSQGTFGEQVMTNFYCYITIQSQFKANQTLEILNSCISNNELQPPISLKALTLYHIASIYFKVEQYAKCIQKCRGIIQEFIGLYYSLDKRLDRNQSQQILRQELQQILYYVFLMMGYISMQQNNLQTSCIYADAGKRILKDRKDVLSLTTKSGMNSPSKAWDPISEDTKQSTNFLKMRNSNSIDEFHGHKPEKKCYSDRKPYYRSETCEI